MKLTKRELLFLIRESLGVETIFEQAGIGNLAGRLSIDAGRLAKLISAKPIDPAKIARVASRLNGYVVNNPAARKALMKYAVERGLADRGLTFAGQQASKQVARTAIASSAEIVGVSAGTASATMAALAIAYIAPAAITFYQIGKLGTWGGSIENLSKQTKGTRQKKLGRIQTEGLYYDQLAKSAHGKSAKEYILPIVGMIYNDQGVLGARPDNENHAAIYDWFKDDVLYGEDWFRVYKEKEAEAQERLDKAIALGEKEAREFIANTGKGEAPKAQAPEAKSKAKGWDRYIERSKDKDLAVKVRDGFIELANKGIVKNNSFTNWVDFYNQMRNDSETMTAAGKKTGEHLNPQEVINIYDYVTGKKSALEETMSRGSLYRQRYSRY